MTPSQRNKILRKQQLDKLKDLELLKTDTVDGIVVFLEAALKEITDQINTLPASDFEAWRLPQLQTEIKRALTDLQRQLKTAGNKAAPVAWQNGVDRVIMPLAAAAPDLLNTNLIQINVQRLEAMRVFMLDRLEDIAAGAVGKINAQLGLVAIGATDRHEAVNTVEKLLTEGGKRRAQTIVDTELSRMSEVARHETHTRAAALMPQVKKKWRRSGKIHSRKAHDVADGQIVDADKPFIVGGDKMMHPHDPKAPIKQVVNCGCKSLMHVDDWNVTNPGKKAFTEQELKLSPLKNELANMKPLGVV